MATRSNTTYKKRQKEAARMEKSRDKLAKRQARKAEKANLGPGGNQDEDIIALEAGLYDRLEEVDLGPVENDASGSRGLEPKH